MNLAPNTTPPPGTPQMANFLLIDRKRTGHKPIYVNLDQVIRIAESDSNEKPPANSKVVNLFMVDGVCLTATLTNEEFDALVGRGVGSAAG